MKTRSFFLRSLVLTSILETVKEGEDGGFDKVESDGRFQLLEANGYPDSMLVINNTVMEDRGEYMCYAENYLGSSNSTVLIRVIGLLFPLLGGYFESWWTYRMLPREGADFLFRFSSFIL